MGGFEVGGLLGNCGGLRDTVEPCLCRDGHRSMGLMGWWWETEMSRNRQPFRVGLVREAYWGPSSLPLTEQAWGGLTGGGAHRKKTATVQQGSHTSLYHTFIILVRDRSQQPMASKEPTVCVCQRCCDQLLLYRTSGQAHICALLAGSKQKETYLAGCLVWRAWFFGSQGLLDISESRHKNVNLIRII